MSRLNTWNKCALALCFLVQYNVDSSLLFGIAGCSLIPATAIGSNHLNQCQEWPSGIIFSCGDAE
jgi:hypothetical protein